MHYFKLLIVSFGIIFVLTINGYASEWKSAIPIELFTSQGCNTCPPADRFLNELAKDDSILPLSLHVNYWNYLGWKDVFSHSKFSKRQRDYAMAIGSRMIYTPQMVVNGSYFLVGSDRERVYNAITISRSQLESEELLGISYDPQGNFFQINNASYLDFSNLAILYMIYDPESVTTDVTAGENKDYQIVNSHVVIELKEIKFEQPVTARGEFEFHIEDLANCETGKNIALIFQSTVSGKPSKIHNAYYTSCSFMNGN